MNLLYLFRTYIAKFQRNHSVDKAINIFHNAIAKLEATAEHHDNLYNLHDEAVKLAVLARKDAAEAADKARALANKLRDLVS